jgi:hypothetical protein
MLASSPIRVRDEQWAWMDGRWVLADMSKSSDFLHILSKADELSAQLTAFAEDLRRRSGLLVSQTLRQEVYQLLLRFTTVRARFVADVVEAGLGIPGPSPGIRHHRPHLRFRMRLPIWAPEEC